MGTPRKPRPYDSYSISAVVRLLKISRATFYRKLEEGVITKPAPLEGTSRQWWTKADIELAKEQLGPPLRRRKMAAFGEKDVAA